MKRWLIISALAALIIGGPLILDSCKKNNPPIPPQPINFVVPPGFPAPTYSFGSNPLTEEGFLLGRRLFFDGQLSIDGNFPSASCHQPVAAFTTYYHDRSHGYNHAHTLRNAPGLFNLAWYPIFRQDGSAQNLDAVYLAHITNPNEMAESVANVIAKLKKDAAYKRMFTAAFGDGEINADRTFKALTQFVISLVSANSKYDRVLQGKASFSPEEENGYAVFRSKCESCHKEPLFTDFAFRNTGLAIDINLKDYGRMRVTGRPDDSLKFRTPSLRNLELTSYYAHDGRFTLPRDMLHHYESGVIRSTTLDPALANGIQLTTTEENDLIFFLRTLSDSAFLNNPRFRE